MNLVRIKRCTPAPSWCSAGVAWLRSVAVVCGLLGGLPIHAGQLILKNTSSAPITCTVDGWTTQSGAKFDWVITVQPKQNFYVGQNMDRSPQIINWANCQGLRTQSMTIMPNGPSGTLLFNGQQTRVLNVSMYPYLPTLPQDTFSSLVNYVVQTYQQQNPLILLNAVLSSEVHIYDFAALPSLLGKQGFDVIELDALYLGFLASSNLINPATITGDRPLPLALQTATYEGQLWGIPSWLCMDFIYGSSPLLNQVNSLGSLLRYFGQLPAAKPAVVGSFNGSWRLPSMYINAYVQTYGYASMSKALQMPPDLQVINNLVLLTDGCDSGGVNNCTNNKYHDMPNGATESVLATKQASDDMGFSEQSFYINLYGPVQPLYAIPAAWGQTAQPLLFSDVFVTNKSTCAQGTVCADDATAFTTLMTGAAMKSYIVESSDLPPGTPWRTLLVSTQPFYQQAKIVSNPMYQQYVSVFANGKPFPNNFTESLQTTMSYAICTALKAQRPAYKCKSGATVSHTDRADHNNFAIYSRGAAK
jgi:thiamine pyridinylase